MAINLKETFDPDEIKNKPVKFIVTIFCLLFFAALIGVLISQTVRYYSGEYTNVFGWEPNGPKRQVKDTFYNNRPLDNTNQNEKDSLPDIIELSAISSKQTGKSKNVSKPILGMPTSERKTSGGIDSPVKQSKDSPTISVQSVQGENVNVGPNYGQVGNNYFTEKELSEPNLKALISHIETLISQNKFEKNHVVLFRAANMNSGKIYRQVSDALQEKGFIISPGTSPAVVKQFSFTNVEGALGVTIGEF